MTTAIQKYNQRVKSGNSLLCVGLDSDFERIPERFKHEEWPQFAFNRWIVEQTHDYVSAYKPNIAFYEAQGDRGLRALHMTMAYLCQNHPDILTICDAKRADVPSTSKAYACAIFNWLGCDAVTLNPYVGSEGLKPFLERADRGCIILCRTSNPGAGEIQDLPVNGRPLWQVVAETVRDHWNAHDNCMLVVGATYPDELRQVRQIVGDMPILVPGIGTQGGAVENTVSAGQDRTGKGLIINASRSVIFAEHPGKAARSLRDQINQYRLSE